jgi:uncharacterized membrane protein
LAALVFVGGHFVLSSAPVRGALIARLGRVPFTGLYAVFAAAAMSWLIVAYGSAPFTELWGDPGWARYLVLLVMPFAAILVVSGVLTPNPTGLLGDRARARDDPAPGIFKITRHPVMSAIALWAAAHLIANGDGASLIFFGALLVLALGGVAHMEARLRAKGDPGWERVVAATSVIPFAAALEGRARISLAEIGWGRMALGVGLYFALLLGHEWAIGASPWPL